MLCIPSVSKSISVRTIVKAFQYIMPALPKISEIEK